jgi:hypothetical protein
LLNNGPQIKSTTREIIIYLFIQSTINTKTTPRCFTDSGAARFLFISLYFELFPISGDVWLVIFIHQWSVHRVKSVLICICSRFCYCCLLPLAMCSKFGQIFIEDGCFHRSCTVYGTLKWHMINDSSTRVHLKNLPTEGKHWNMETPIFNKNLPKLGTHCQRQ